LNAFAVKAFLVLVSTEFAPARSAETSTRSTPAESTMAGKAANDRHGERFDGGSSFLRAIDHFVLASTLRRPSFQ
jgi:hypothetical protein